jgi:Uma2 family endonuclease
VAVTAIESTPVTLDAATEVDPYRYGWRYVRRSLPDGSVVTDQVPLTLDDVLHPEEGDQVMHSAAHKRRCIYLYNVFRARLQSDPSAVVLHDVRVKWDAPELRPHGPDIMVILGVRERKNWSTFDVAAEGVRPALIVEVTSPETRGIDRLDKVDDYDLAGVPLYVIVDTVTRRGVDTIRLLVHTQTPHGYQALPADERGRFWLEPVRLFLGIADNEIVCYDEAGQMLSDYADVTLALAAEREALAAEREARVVAEARVQALEAELRRLRETTS